MTFPVKVFDRQVDSWDERCVHRVSAPRDEDKGGYDVEARYWQDDRVGGANRQLLDYGKWIGENLTGLWSSHTTGSSNIFNFEKESDAILFRLFV
jgi:hypothetical protein